MRVFLLGAMLLLVLGGAGTTTAAQADDASITTIIYEEAARYGVAGSTLYRLALCESTLNPYAVGRQGEIGLFQFHPRGIWQDIPVFDSWADVYNIRLNARGAAWAVSRGLGFHWTCW